MRIVIFSIKKLKVPSFWFACKDGSFMTACITAVCYSLLINTMNDRHSISPTDSRPNYVHQRVNNTRTWLQIFGFNMIQHHPLFSLLHDSYFHFIRSVTDWGKPLVVQSISRLQKTRPSQKAMNQTGFLKRLRLIIAFQNYKGPFPFQRGKGWICLSRDSWYGEKKRTKKQRLRLLVKRFEFDGRMDFCHSKDEKCIKVKRPFLFKAWNLTLMSIVFNCQFFVQ